MNQEVLHLTIMDGKVVWERAKSGPQGFLKRIDGSPPGGDALDEDELHAKTITLLADLQRLAADMRREGKWGTKLFEIIASRVVEALGEQLYRFLFRAPVAKGLHEALDATREGLLRIELEFVGNRAQTYARWPWEYLRRPMEAGVEGNGQFLALCTQLVLNRRLSLKGERALTAACPKVLLVVASPPERSNEPSGEYGIVLAGQVVSRLQALKKDKVIELLKLVEPEFEFKDDWKPTASWDAFKTAVKSHKPDVIHFIGHGRRVYDPNGDSEHSELMFVGLDGRHDWRRDTEFLSVVRDNPKLKLVFLQACESGLRGSHATATNVGQLLAREGIPAVVAMQAKIENLVANEFAAAFYKTLSEQQPVDCAVREGREAIGNTSDTLKLAFGVPVLYLRSYEALISPDIRDSSAETISVPGTGKLALPGTTAEKPRAFEICPRCGSAGVEESCPNCGLQVVCSHCGTALKLNPAPPRGNPMHRFCHRCRTEHVQLPWADDAVTTTISRLPSPSAPVAAEADALQDPSSTRVREIVTRR